jgi:hypothetical protein
MPDLATALTDGLIVYGRDDPVNFGDVLCCRGHNVLSVA